MPLDMFGQTQTDTDAYVQRNNAPRLPVTFGEGFAASWRENMVFGQSVAGENARRYALEDIADDLYKKTGNPAFHPAVVGADLDGLNASIRLANQKDDAGLDEIAPEQLQQRAVEKSKAARAELADVQGREKTLGGSLGVLTGGAAGTAVDPVNLVVAPLAAPEGLGLLATALAWSGIAGGTQAAIEATGSPYRDVVQPGYSASGEPARNILGATAFGGAAGGFFKGLGMAWGRAKTGVWPRSIRDAGNVVESEANVARSNVLPGMEGEVAHREALAKTIDDVVAGRKVEVPESATMPQEPTGPGFDVHHGSPHDFDRFDMSKIGTGEGAQAYGHGLYFAETEGVARSYAIPRTGGGMGFVGKMSDLPRGNMYRVRINADSEHFLDWDKPLTEQSDFVRNAILNHPDPSVAGTAEKHGAVSGAAFVRRLESTIERDHRPAPTGELVPDYNARIAGQRSARAQASDILHKAGIPGIKYLDQVSRGVGEGSRNFVLFDDKLAQITHKNGEPLSLFDAHEARVDMLMDERAGIKAAEASATPGKEVAPELPLVPAKTEVHEGTIADGVQNIARMTGYDMPREEAEKIAKMVAGASDDERARAILNTVFDRPQTVADFPPSPLPKARPEPRGDLDPAAVAKTIGSTEHEAALRADIDRARAEGDVKIPAGVDEKGDPVFRSVDAAMDEIDAYKAAAEQIKACANPQPEPAEAA